MNTYKIAIFTPYNIFKAGGVHEHVTNQARILKERGHDVTIITPRPMDHDDDEAPEGVVFIGGSRRIKSPHATSADVSFTLDTDSIKAELDKNYDIIHVHEPLVPIGARQILSYAEGKALRIGTFHAALPGNMIGKSLAATYKTYARSVLPHVDCITAVSPAAVGYIEDYTDAPINYIANGIDLKQFRPMKGAKRDLDHIVFIGRLEKRKGVYELLQAYEFLKTIHPTARLTICGDGPLRSSLESYVDNNGVEDVVFEGFITDERKIELLSTCGLYTSPALYGESFGIVLAEAMAMNVPTVCHPNDGYAWVMKGAGRLSVVNCKDHEAYAHRMALLLEEPELRNVWQGWAKSYVAQFDYEHIVDQYEALYEKNLQE